MDTFELLRSVYFTRAGNSLPEIHRSVPKIEADFYMWLACRKQQWRQHRSNKRARRQLTPEEDFPRQKTVAENFSLVCVYAICVCSELAVRTNQGRGGGQEVQEAIPGFSLLRCPMSNRMQQVLIIFNYMVHVTHLERVELLPSPCDDNTGPALRHDILTFGLGCSYREVEN